MFFGIAAAFVVLLFAPSAQADLIQDGGFESTPVPTGLYLDFGGGSTIGGVWNVQGNDVLLIQNNYTEPNGPGGSSLVFNAEQGSNSLDLTGAGNTGPTDGVTQTVATVTGQTYALSFWVGQAGGGSQYYLPPAIAGVSINGGARVDFTNAANLPSGGVNWEQFTTDFTATSTSTTIGFYNDTPLYNNECGLDNVTLTAVPEPTRLLALSGLASMGLLGLVWRKRK